LAGTFQCGGRPKKGQTRPGKTPGAGVLAAKFHNPKGKKSTGGFTPPEGRRKKPKKWGGFWGKHLGKHIKQGEPPGAPEANTPGGKESAQSEEPPPPKKRGEGPPL